MASTLELELDLTVEKPNIDALVGGEGAFDKMLCSISDLMDSQYKKGRVKGTDYAKVLADSIATALKTSSDFTIQRELIAAQSLYYKWQAEKFKRDSILVTSQEIKMKAELANEVLKGCFTKEQTNTQKQETLKKACEVIKCQKETLKIEAETSRVNQETLKLVEDTAISHAMIDQTKAKTVNIQSQTLLINEQTKHEVKKKLLTTTQTDFIYKQALHELKKTQNTVQDTALLVCKTKTECAREDDVKAHTKWQLEHALVEHELIAYTKAKASLELKRIALMEAQIALERAKLPLICAQTKVELRKADVMVYDAMLKKASAFVKAKEVAIRKAEIGLMCARSKVENMKAFLTKYQALGLYEQSKTEQVKREVAKYGVIESKAKAKSMLAQTITNAANAQLLKQKVVTELHQAKVLEGKLKLFSAQYTGFANDAKLREKKLRDDISISAATISGLTTSLDQTVTVPLTDPSDFSISIEKEAEVEIPEIEDSELLDTSGDITLPEGDTVEEVECGAEDDSAIDFDPSAMQFSEIDCTSGEISINKGGE